MKIKSIFTILALGYTCAYANVEPTEPAKEQTQQEIAEDKIFKLLSEGNDPFSYGSARGAASGSASMVNIDISNISTSIKLKGVFKLSSSDESYALVQIGEDRNARRQLVKKDDLILISNSTNSRNAQSKASKYLKIVEIHENTIVIAPQMRPDETIVIR
ncbi:MAG: hypothetical protein R3Y46_04915 [Opitutales bacterium]